MKTYYYATYQEHEDRPISVSLIQANSKKQISQRGLNLFEHCKRFEDDNKAFNFLMTNATSLGYTVSYNDIKEYDVVS